MWGLDGTHVNNRRNSFKNPSGEDFPGDSIVKTPHSQWRMPVKKKINKKVNLVEKNKERYSRRLKDIM